VNGFAHGFNRKAGKRVWTTKIEQQTIVLGQPENLPILVFSSRMSVIRNQVIGGRARRTSYTVLSIDLLDTRNGRILFAYKGRQSVYPYVLTVDPVKKTIDVNFYQTAVTLKMSQSPLNSPNQYTKPMKPAVIPVKKPVNGAKPVGQIIGKIGAVPVAQPVSAVRQIEVQRKR
jgi:hypothetical protein